MRFVSWGTCITGTKIHTYINTFSENTEITHMLKLTLELWIPPGKPARQSAEWDKCTRVYDPNTSISTKFFLLFDFRFYVPYFRSLDSIPKVIVFSRDLLIKYIVTLVRFIVIVVIIIIPWVVLMSIWCSSFFHVIFLRAHHHHHDHLTCKIYFYDVCWKGIILDAYSTNMCVGSFFCLCTYAPMTRGRMRLLFQLLCKLPSASLLHIHALTLHKKLFHALLIMLYCLYRNSIAEHFHFHLYYENPTTTRYYYCRESMVTAHQMLCNITQPT